MWKRKQTVPTVVQLGREEGNQRGRLADDREQNE
jgi:hypothetical protein